MKSEFIRKQCDQITAGDVIHLFNRDGTTHLALIISAVIRHNNSVRVIYLKDSRIGSFTKISYDYMKVLDVR